MPAERPSGVTIRDASSEEELAELFILAKRAGLLPIVFQEGEPSLSWWLNWVATRCPLFLLAIDDSTGSPIGAGWVNAFVSNFNHKRAEVGFIFLPKLKSPFAYISAARRMLEIARHRLKPDLMLGTIPIHNDKAIAFAKRLGFKQVAVIPKYTIWYGRPSDAAILIMEL